MWMNMIGRAAANIQLQQKQLNTCIWVTVLMKMKKNPTTYDARLKIGMNIQILYKTMYGCKKKKRLKKKRKTIPNIPPFSIKPKYKHSEIR